MNTSTVEATITDSTGQKQTVKTPFALAFEETQEKLHPNVEQVIQIAKAVSKLSLPGDVPRDLVFKAAVQSVFEYVSF